MFNTLSKREREAILGAITYEFGEWIEVGKISGIGDATITRLVEKGLAEYRAYGELYMPTWRLTQLGYEI